MARKIYIKTAAIISLCCGIFIILSACMVPVDMDEFFKPDGPADTFITNTVNNSSPSTPKNVVIVDDKTGDNLKGGNNVITNLNDKKYYLVEKEVAAEGAPAPTNRYPMYVTEYTFPAPSLSPNPGQLVDDLGLITRIPNKTITGLTNSNTYTVRAALPFFDGLPFTYSDSDATGVKNQTVYVANGAINISPPKGNFSLEQLYPQFNGYEVMGVSVRPDSFPSASPFYNPTKKTIGSTVTSFQLEGADTEVDYIFVKPDVPSNFFVLTVIIGAAPPTVITDKAIQGVTPPAIGATPVSNITETAQYTGTVSWAGALVDGKFGPSTVYTATITLSPKTGFTLNGVEANFFTVAGATTVSNSADSGVITAVFPATEAAKGSLTITFTVSDASITPNITSVLYSELAGGTMSLIFTLINGPYTDVTWKLDNVTASGGTNTGLTINSTSNLLPYLVPGQHYLYVEGTAKGGQNNNYSAYIVFTVSVN